MKKLPSVLFGIFSSALFLIFSVISLFCGVNNLWFANSNVLPVLLIMVVPTVVFTVATWYCLTYQPKKTTYVSTPLLFFTSVFEIASYTLAIVFAQAISKSGKSIAWYVWMFAVVLMIVYTAIFLYILLERDIFAKRRQDTKDKVNYLRKMVSMLDAVLPTVSADTVKKEVTDLRNALRFSDPISSEEIYILEESLYQTVDFIVQQVKAGADYESFKPQIIKAKELIAQRNDEVRMSK